MQKRVFPVAFFTFSASFMGMGLYLVMVRHRLQALAFIVMPAILAVFGYVMMKRLIFDLVDEVWDDGDGVLVKNRGKQHRIDLKDITNVSYTPLTNPPRVTLTVRSPAWHAPEVSFMPPRHFFGRDRSVECLIERIDAIRNR
ncbi:MAG: hypothetical protein IPK07_29610 [Deltaproteobacteria bacterium]|nr:hypothetical protein [Deltaproteobacteria bacterium]